MTRTTSAIEQVSISEAEKLYDQHQSTIISKILQKLSKIELPEQERVQCYMRHKWRMNHKPNSLRNSFKAIELFLIFYSSLGKRRLEEIVREDLEAFVENEQDRGTKITSARTRLMYLMGFLRFLIEDNIIPEALLRRKIRLKLPDLLPRAMHPGDVRQLLSVMKDQGVKSSIVTFFKKPFE